MADALLKRTTFVVDDAAAAAEFYKTVFGFSVWYDNTLPVDARFPPTAPDQAMARLIILEVEDPKIGKLGFLSYLDHDPQEDPTWRGRTQLRRGDTVLVMETHDLPGVHARAAAYPGARVVTPPVDWSVPGPDGKPIQLTAMSLFDPSGIYCEISKARG